MFLNFNAFCARSGQEVNATVSLHLGEYFQKYSETGRHSVAAGYMDIIL